MKINPFTCVLVATAAILSAISCDSDDEVPQSQVPVAVTSAFSQMYPQAKNVEWEKTPSYYIAEFYVNTFDTDVWFSPSSTWAMTETNYGNLVSMLPEAVTSAFNSSQFASMIVDDASLYERPGANSFCEIEVERFRA